MDSVTVSPKFQVVIPRAVREQARIKPGQKMRVLAYGDKIILIPIRPIQEARGCLKVCKSMCSAKNWMKNGDNLCKTS